MWCIGDWLWRLYWFKFAISSAFIPYGFDSSRNQSHLLHTSTSTNAQTHTHKHQTVDYDSKLYRAHTLIHAYCVCAWLGHVMRGNCIQRILLNMFSVLNTASVFVRRVPKCFRRETTNEWEKETKHGFIPFAPFGLLSVRRNTGGVFSIYVCVPYDTTFRASKESKHNRKGNGNFLIIAFCQQFSSLPSEYFTRFWIYRN